MNKRRMKRRIASLEERLFQSRLPEPPPVFLVVEVQVDVPGGPEILSFPMIPGGGRPIIDLPAMGYVVRRKS